MSLSERPGAGMCPCGGRTLPVWCPAGSICIRAYKPLSHGTQQCGCPVAPSCLTLRSPMDCSMPGFPVHHQLPEFTQTLMSIELVMPSNHLILCRPLLLLPSIFPSIRVFPVISWPKYWSFNISISPSNEYSGLISFKMDWLDLLAVRISPHCKEFT